MIKKIEELPLHYFKQGLTLVHKAIGFDKTARYDESINFYKKAKDNFCLSLHQPQLNSQLRDIAQNYINQITRRLDEIQFSNKNSTNFNYKNINIVRPLTSPNKTQSNVNNYHPIIQPNMDQSTMMNYRNTQPIKDPKKLISAIFVKNPVSKWEDVVCPTEAKQELTQSLIMPFKIPQFFQGNRKPFKCILLYGPPGSGKSYISKSLSQEIPRSTFFNLSSTEIITNIIDGCPNYFDILLNTACSKSPSIIFIDEIDSIFYEPSILPSIKFDILKKMEHIENSINDVFLIGSTNIPWQLPPEVLKNFKKKIYIPIPDIECRKHLIKNELKSIKNSLTEKNVDSLAKLTNGYSIADIIALIKNASMVALKKIQDAQYFMMKNCRMVPCSSSTPGAIRSTFDQLTDSQRKLLLPPEIDCNCFIESLKIVKPSNSPVEIEKYNNWIQQLGNDRFWI